MKVATRDRGEIIHFAGLHGLSPALREGAPAFVSGADPTAERCGWEPFFRALDERRLALVHDPADPGAHEFRSVGEVGDMQRKRASLGEAIAHARRFWRALFPASSAAPRSRPAA